MESIANTLQIVIEAMKANLPLVLWLFAGLWAITIVNALLSYRLNVLGIWPRHPFGLVGIVFSPFLHGDFNHLMFNTLPLFVLVNFILLQGQHTFFCVSIAIILLSGLLVWLFARPGIHIGASGLVMGYWGYLLIHAYYQPSILAIVLAVVCIYYFGSLVINLFPSKAQVSWEGHVFGFIAGIAANYLCVYWQ